MGNLLSMGRRDPQNPDPLVDPYEVNQYPNMGDYIDMSSYKEGFSFRLQFKKRPFAQGYPSKGGYLIRRVTGVEIGWLGLDKMRERQTSRTQPEEDEFCRKLRHVGAKWWEYPGQELSIENTIKTAPIGELDIETGRPSTGGGVWVLTKQCDKGRAAVRQCRSMDERSRMIEELGGKFYHNPEDCEDLSSDCRIVNGTKMPMFATTPLYSQPPLTERQVQEILNQQD